MGDPATPRSAAELPVSNDVALAYIGSSRGLETTLVRRPDIRSHFFPMAPPSSARGLMLLGLATIRSLVVIARLRPRVTFATGGYVSAPVALASRLMRVPVVLFLPDVVPGQAVSWLTPRVQRIAASTEASLHYLPATRTVVTGYPVRESVRQASRDEARLRLGLGAGLPVLYVTGGSQGSRSINTSLARDLPAILRYWQVIHVCGRDRLTEAREASMGLSDDATAQYHLYPYLDDMAVADALAAADLVLCRSGASVLGELPATGTPGLLVPLPAARVHQRENAEYLADRGAGIVLEDAELAERLLPLLRELAADPSRLAAMGSACRALDHPEAAAAIAALILEAAA